MLVLFERTRKGLLTEWLEQNPLRQWRKQQELGVHKAAVSCT